MSEEQIAEQVAATPSQTPPPDPLARTVVYHFAPAEVDAQVDKRLMQLAKNARVNGFRPGRVPMRVMRERWGGGCIAETLAEKAQEKFAAEADTMNERPMSSPQISPSVVAAADGYRVECRYEVMPDIAAPDLSAQKIRRPVLTVGDAETDEMIARLRRDAGEYKETERPARADDRVNVDFVARREGETIEEEKNRDWPLNSPMLKDIADSIVGASAGDTREVKINHPDDHPDESLRGAQTQMEVKINKVFELHPHPLDNSFFAQFGVDGDENNFREMVKDRLTAEVDMRIRRSVHEQAMNALLAATPQFDLPRSLVRAEAAGMIDGMRKEARAHGVPDTTVKMTPQIVSAAVRRVALGLIIGKWREREKIEIAENELETRLHEIATSYQNPEEYKTRARADQRTMHALHLEIIEQRAAAWVCERADTADEKTSLSDLLAAESHV